MTNKKIITLSEIKYILMDTQIVNMIGKLPPAVQHNLLEYMEYLFQKYLPKSELIKEEIIENDDIELTDAGKLFLQKRLDAHNANLEEAVSVEDFKKEIVAKYGYVL